MMSGVALPTSLRDTACAHCGQPIASEREDAYCCRGCRAVATLLLRSGLTRYYDLRGTEGVPVPEISSRARDFKWLEPIEARVREEDSVRVVLGLQGVHCSACVWLVETLFARASSAGSAEVNPALGRCTLVLPRGFPLRDFLTSVEAFGYRFGPPNEKEARGSDALLVRTGIALALAGNTMMLGAAMHLGLRDGIVYTWASRVSFVTAILATLVGAPVFLRSALSGLRRGILHLDLPIVIGMGLALTGSVWSFLAGGGANYVDTLAVFVALMLLGRFLQARVLDRNRRELLADLGTESLLVRVIREGRAVLLPSTHVVTGDEVLLASGDLLPVAARLVDGASSFSFDWVDGESRPRAIAQGDVVPAGAFLVDETAARLVAVEDFSASEVATLLHARPDEASSTRTHAGLPKHVGAAYVLLVLAAGLTTFLVTLARGLGVVSAFEATTAALVVTCPCAFGIAVPLAYEITQSRLRRAGIYVRRPTLFDRALRVRNVVFDKTGTLTTGKLRIEDDAPLRALDETDAIALAEMLARSSHPKSRALEEALHRVRVLPPLDENARVAEARGRGLALTRGGHEYKLGSAAFTEVTSDRDLVFTRDGVLLAALSTAEELRPETELELRKLRRMGLRVFILSGDATANVARIAAHAGVPETQAIAEASPEAKAAWVRAHEPERTLVLGDGINDALALEAAGCAGTPSVERPFTAARSDFYFVTPGLGAVAQILRAARRLANVVRADLAIAVAYNVFAVGLCIAGVMKPWLAALLMPASSLGTIAFTVIRLGRKENP